MKIVISTLGRAYLFHKFHRKLYKEIFLIIIMETVTITKKEYHELKKFKKVDQELLQTISNGIKDILEGKVKEI